MKNKVLAMFLILTILSLGVKTYATTILDYQSQQKQTQDEKDKAKENLQSVTSEKNTVQEQVASLNESISGVQADLSDLQDKIDELDNSIDNKQKELLEDHINKCIVDVVGEEQLEEKQKLLEERLVASYMNGSTTYMDALFSGGISNFISNYETIKQIAEYDNNLMADVKNTKAELESEKSKVETAKKDKETKNAELKKLKSEKETKVNSLTDEQKQIQAQMEEYDSQMKVLEQKEKAIAEAARKKAEQEKNNAKNNNNENSGNNGGSTTPTGSFQWPVPSSHNITSNYGYRIHPISGTKKLHAGIDIGAAGGADIVAADAGTVILSSFGYNGGYGNYVIISHGNGITTRYAHCSNLYVSVGQSVSKGQTIAAVGSTGASTGNHCHFEVRIDGESKNPLNYL